MKRFSQILVALGVTLTAAPAYAADDWTFKDSAGATQTIRAFSDGSNRKMNAHVSVDASGSERFTTANPGYVVLPSGAIISISSSGITSIDAKTPALVGGRVPVDGSGITQPVSSGALGLPADPAWDGTSTSASIVSILKGLPRTAGTGGGTASSVAVTSLPALAAGSNVIGSVNVVGGNSVALKVDGSATTQPVSGSVSVSALPTLPAGANAIGSVLSDLRVGGSAVAPGNPVPVTPTGTITLSPNGLGSLTVVPTSSTNGTPLSASPPAGKRGARLYVPPGASISFTIAAAQPGSAPTTITVANPSTNTVPANWDEDLAGTQMIYVTAVTGSPMFRWY